MKIKKRGVLALPLLLALLFFPFQRAEAAGTRKLVPVGAAVGIQVDTQGVVVARAEGGKVRPGDVILEMNGQKVCSGEDIRRAAAALKAGEDVELLVLRDGEEKRLTQAVDAREDGTAAMGLWLRDQVSGIGTVTYVDPDNGEFGALGHGVNDPDCSLRLPLRGGMVTRTRIDSVQEGTAGAPGQLCGGLDPDRPVGQIEKNTDKGIFGHMTDTAWIYGQAVETAEYSEIRLGDAQILSNVDGEKVQAYQVEIIRLYGGQDRGRDLMLRVTDEELLKKTGGIVQGMSGSPILQDGKLIGAVTHVLVAEPTKGYGVAIGHMLDAAA